MNTQESSIGITITQLAIYQRYIHSTCVLCPIEIRSFICDSRPYLIRTANFWDTNMHITDLKRYNNLPSIPLWKLQHSNVEHPDDDSVILQILTSEQDLYNSWLYKGLSTNIYWHLLFLQNVVNSFVIRLSWVIWTANTGSSMFLFKTLSSQTWKVNLVHNIWMLRHRFKINNSTGLLLHVASVYFRRVVRTCTTNIGKRSKWKKVGWRNSNSKKCICVRTYVRTYVRVHASVGGLSTLQLAFQIRLVCAL